jgi:anti-sigma-K factor RskA
MTDEDDIDGLAAEYVLGSLDPAERKLVDARSLTDPALMGAIKTWQKRLGPLNDQVPGIEPPPHLLAGVLKRIGPEQPSTRSQGHVIQAAEVAALRRSARRWRAFSVGTSALAACLALIAAWLWQNLPDRPTGRAMNLIAVLQRAATTSDEGTTPASPPGFVVSVDANARTILVSPVAVRPSPRRSYQLWLVQSGVAAPSSLGVISQSETSTLPLRAPVPAGDLASATLSVSLEPEGGSTTGAPTGPIVFVGRLMQATP